MDSVYYGEAGEGGLYLPFDKSAPPPTPQLLSLRKKLTLNEAHKHLSILGKDETGVRFAYLMLTVADRYLTDVSVISEFKHLLYLDLTGNLLDLTALSAVCSLPNLTYLRVERNRLESAALEQLPYLQVLILNKNMIEETGSICQPMLKTLELGENSIYSAQFDCEELPGLKELCLHGNHLEAISGPFPLGLEKLFLAHNKIRRISSNLSKLKNLKVLHLRDNKIRKLDGFASDLSKLTYLNLRNNNIDKVRQLRKLQDLPSLDVLILLGNPLYREKGQHVRDDESTDEETEPEDLEGNQSEDQEEEGQSKVAATTPLIKARLKILVLLPNLKRIDKIPVTDVEKELANEHKDQLLQEIFEEESSEDEVEISTTDYTATGYTTETETELKHIMEYLKISRDTEEDER